MNEKDYNSAEGIRRSDLWRMEDSPEKFKYFLDHPVEQTPAMAFGSACHKYVLELDDFDSEYVTAPNINRRTNAGKEEWERFCELNAGKTVISPDDMQVMAEMREALIRCPLAKKLLFGKGEVEVPLFWTDKETGEKCKAKLDRLVKYNRRPYIVDYKTCQNAETFKFNSEIWRLGYYFQAGMYAEGYKAANRKKKLPGFLFVAQEKKPPYSMNVIEVSEDVMTAGVVKFHELLKKMHECREADLWAGYVNDIPNDAFVPTWMQQEFEDEI